MHKVWRSIAAATRHLQCARQCSVVSITDTWVLCWHPECTVCVHLQTFNDMPCVLCCMPGLLAPPTCYQGVCRGF